MGGDNSGDVGGLVDPWAAADSVCGGFRDGMRRRRNLRFLINTLPDLVLT